MIPPRSGLTFFPYTTLFRSRINEKENTWFNQLLLFRVFFRLFEGWAPGIRESLTFGAVINAEEFEKGEDLTRLNIIMYASKKDRKSTRLNSSHANISYAVFF